MTAGLRRRRLRTAARPPDDAEGTGASPSLASSAPVEEEADAPLHQHSVALHLGTRLEALEQRLQRLVDWLPSEAEDARCGASNTGLEEWVESMIQPVLEREVKFTVASLARSAKVRSGSAETPKRRGGRELTSSMSEVYDYFSTLGAGREVPTPRARGDGEDDSITSCTTAGTSTTAGTPSGWGFESAEGEAPFGAVAKKKRVAFAAEPEDCPAGGPAGQPHADGSADRKALNASKKRRATLRNHTWPLGNPAEEAGGPPGARPPVGPDVGPGAPLPAATGDHAPPSNDPASVCTLQIIHVTDVYTLENFPSLRTLIMEKRAELERLRGSPNSKTISCLTGDFLMPYLLSSLDCGRGMMEMLNETPIDYLTWGNHEADLSHVDVMAREKEYTGIWINSNMTDHESFPESTCQTRAAIVEIASADGSNVRKVGMIGILSDDPGLYKPGAFGGAIIDDPWEVIQELKDELEGEDGVDLVLPLSHLYEVQDERTANEFNFPVIIGGHDHHKVDRIINGTRLLKPGCDGHLATVLTLTWNDARSTEPEIRAEFVQVAQWEADARLQRLCEDSYSVLDRLRLTELTVVPEKFNPFSSVGTRGGPSTCATYLCTSIRDALNLDCVKDTQDCDCVLINGGNIRGNRDYPAVNGNRSVITLETLRSELDVDVCIFVVRVPGRVLRDALRDTWQQPSGAWMHHDDQVFVDADGFVTHVAGENLDMDREYRIGTSTRFGVRLAPKILSYLDADPKRWPGEDSGVPVHTILMHLYAECAWMRIWNYLDPDNRGEICSEALRTLDVDSDGMLDKKELMAALTAVGLSAHGDETALVDIILSMAGGHDHQGAVSVTEVNARRRERVKHLKPLKEHKHRSTRLEFLLSERKTLSPGVSPFVKT